MLEMKIPQEINKYESKLVGPLTTRQTLSIIAAGVLCVLFFKIFKGLIPDDYLYVGCFVIAFPFGIIGWWKPYGMPAEKFFLAVLFNTIISSSRRFFKSNNVVNKIEQKLTVPAVQELDKKKKKKQKQAKKVDPKKIQKKYKKQTML